MNKPYVKQYDQNGNVTNPIDHFYPNLFRNRKMRRDSARKEQFYGNSKNFHLTVLGISKYKRVKQTEFDKNGNKKTIFHYLIIK